MKRTFKALVFPFYMLVMLPVEYNLWKAYCDEGKTTQNLIQFIWSRM